MEIVHQKSTSPAAVNNEEKPKLMISHGKANFIISKNVFTQETDTRPPKNTISQTLCGTKYNEMPDNGNTTEANANEIKPKLDDKSNTQQPWIGTLKKINRHANSKVLQSQSSNEHTSPVFSANASPLLVRKFNVIKHSNEENSNTTNNNNTVAKPEFNELQEKLQKLRTADSSDIQQPLQSSYNSLISVLASPLTQRKINIIKQASETNSSSSSSMNSNSVKMADEKCNLNELNTKLQSRKTTHVNEMKQILKCTETIEKTNTEVCEKNELKQVHLNNTSTSVRHNEHGQYAKVYSKEIAATKQNELMSSNEAKSTDGKITKIFSSKFNQAINNIHAAVALKSSENSNTILSDFQQSEAYQQFDETTEVRTEVNEETDSSIISSTWSEKKQTSYDSANISTVSPIAPRKSQVFKPQQHHQPQSPQITKPTIHHLKNGGASPNFNVKPIVSFSKDLNTTPNRYPDMVKVIKTSSENHTYNTTTRTLNNAESKENIYFSDLKFIINENGEVVHSINQ